jgi:hypothetical protein
MMKQELIGQGNGWKNGSVHLPKTVINTTLSEASVTITGTNNLIFVRFTIVFRYKIKF